MDIRTGEEKYIANPSPDPINVREVCSEHHRGKGGEDEQQCGEHCGRYFYDPFF